jgi:hypothetical protein
MQSGNIIKFLLAIRVAENLTNAPGNTPEPGAKASRDESQWRRLFRVEGGGDLGRRRRTESGPS